MLPFELVYYIQTFLKWRDRVNMVSREWLHMGLRKRIRLHRWSSKLRIYSYQHTFGPQMTRMSWPRLANVFGITRRARNRSYRLSWREAVKRHVTYNRCLACGQKTSACVMGYHICQVCRHNSDLVNAYMVNVQTALAFGIPRRILRQIPYHRCNKSHLRFWSDIENKMNML